VNVPSTFRLNHATFDFGNEHPVQVDFIADQESKASKSTHFTLLMGPNGTCKSRILSCCINLLKGIEERERSGTSRKEQRPLRSDETDRDLRCDSATLVRDGVSSAVGHGKLNDHDTVLPSRVLAVANLVHDRFTFADWETSDNPFYYYLGVRQASNLTTTGAMGRRVCDAVLKLLGDEDKYSYLSKWTRTLFPCSELGLVFPDLSQKAFDQFLEQPEAWIRRRTGSPRPEEFYVRVLNEIQAHIPDIVRLRALIEENGQSSDDSGSLGMRRGRTFTLCLDRLSHEVRFHLGRLNHALRLASSVHLLGRPSLVINSRKWLDFMQLSSGEQNLIATGARLFAFAVPGSLIVIDEPEVSLNIAWQQRYIDLISQALVHAKGSHVIIASHSPYLVSDLRAENSTVVVIERSTEGLKFRSHPGEFWGWGSEAILYEILGLPSASNYHFSRELAGVLKLVSEKSTDAERFAKFLRKCDQLDFGAQAQPLRVVIKEIRNYAGGLQT